MKKKLIIFLILLFQLSLPYILNANSTIKVGVYNNEPLLFADAAGKGKGVFADIIEYVASKEGWQIEYVTGTWGQGLKTIRSIFLAPLDLPRPEKSCMTLARKT